MNIILIFCIIVSILSQIAPLESVIRPIMYASWPIACLYYLVAFKGKLHVSRFTIYFAATYLVFILYCITCYLFGADNLERSYLKLLYIPLMLCCIGDCYAPHLTSKKFERLCRVYIWAALAFGIWVHFTYFPSIGSWLNSMAYDFTQKNSAAQIWGTAILVNTFLIPHKSSLTKQISLCITGYFCFLILVSQCRTALLGLTLVLLYNVIFYSKQKIVWIIALLAGVQLVLYLPSLHNFINHSLLFTKYEGADVDAFSSGRLGLYTLAWKTFLSSPLIGVGRYYVDCSYLSVLTENGIIGFILIESIWFYKISLHFISALKDKLYKQTGKHSKQTRFLVSIVIFYMVESMLEGYPPFGPGVSSLAFWLFSGIVLKRRDLITD